MLCAYAHMALLVEHTPLTSQCCLLRRESPLVVGVLRLSSDHDGAAQSSAGGLGHGSRRPDAHELKVGW